MSRKNDFSCHLVARKVCVKRKANSLRLPLCNACFGASNALMCFWCFKALFRWFERSISTKKPPTRGRLFWWVLMDYSAYAPFTALIGFADRDTSVSLSLVVKPTPRWFERSHFHQKTSHKGRLFWWWIGY